FPPPLRGRTPGDAPEQHLDLGNAESNLLGEAHHREPLQDIWVVAAPASGAGRLRQQADFLIVTNRRGLKARPAGDDADAQAGHKSPLDLKLTSTRSVAPSCNKITGA